MGKRIRNRAEDQGQASQQAEQAPVEVREQYVFHRRQPRKAGVFRALSPKLEIHYALPEPAARAEVLPDARSARYKKRQREVLEERRALALDTMRAAAVVTDEHEPELVELALPTFEEEEATQLDAAHDERLREWLAAHVIDVVGLVDEDGETLRWADFTEADRLRFVRSLPEAWVIDLVGLCVDFPALGIFRSAVKNS